MVSGKQNDCIATHLKRGGTLTHLSAYHLFRCMRLAARVKELRDLGHNIQTQMLTLKSGKRVAQYYLSEARL